MRSLSVRLALASVVVLAAALFTLDACTGDDPLLVDGSSDASPGADVAPVPDASPDGAVAEAAGAREFVAATIGDFAACAVAQDGSTWCWGSNAFGMLGDPSAKLLRPTGQRLPTPPPALVTIAAGAGHVCGTTASGEVWCWGLNDHGQLGHDPSEDPKCAGDIRCSPVPRKVPNVVASAVVGFWASTCALSKAGDVLCWGDGEAGLLGEAKADGGAPAPGTSSFAPVPVAWLPAGKVRSLNGARWPGHTACAVLDDATTRCWGQNSWGGLGHFPGSNGDKSSGANPRCDYCNPTPTEVDAPLVGGGSGALAAVQAVVGGYTSCAIVGMTHELSCWGANFCGQVAPTDVDGGVGTFTPQPTRVIADPVDSVGVGDSICAVLYNKQVRCWGSDGNDIVGLAVDAGAACKTDDGLAVEGTATPTARANLAVRTLDVGHTGVVAIDQNGHVIAWGRNDLGQLGHAVGSNGDDPNKADRNPAPLPVEGLDAP